MSSNNEEDEIRIAQYDAIFRAQYGEQFETLLRVLQESVPMLEALDDICHRDSLVKKQFEKTLEQLPSWVFRSASTVYFFRPEEEQ